MSIEGLLEELKSISFKKLFDLSGKKAIVTGGGGGICSAIAYGLAEFGADIALIDINAENLEKVKNFLKERFPERKVLAFVADVCSYQEVSKVVEDIVKEFNRIDILVNCHGIGQWVPAEIMRLDDWDKMIRTNLTSVFIMCQIVGKYMIKQRYGKIINIASMSGHIVNTPQPQAHYNTSKAGVIHLTKSLAAEWAKYNVYVNSVSPGYTVTPLVEKLLKQEPKYAEIWRSMIPLGRFAKPYDIVGVVIFLASDASNYITGEDIIVDGGYTIL
ncbi:MAG: SDR family oxidoreductase [Desulfurococcaceae archaeon]|jgi:NAD(P)-dependent dehydrogenase (short-subunit alcohol dehydrogenase family)|nr:SDR family oxidoreductase [Desulfurococcaceae archaeon]